LSSKVALVTGAGSGITCRTQASASSGATGTAELLPAETVITNKVATLIHHSMLIISVTSHRCNKWLQKPLVHYTEQNFTSRRVGDSIWP